MKAYVNEEVRFGICIYGGRYMASVHNPEGVKSQSVEGREGLGIESHFALRVFLDKFDAFGDVALEVFKTDIQELLLILCNLPNLVNLLHAVGSKFHFG